MSIILWWKKVKKRKRERENVNYYCLRGTLLYRAGPFLRTIGEPNSEKPKVRSGVESVYKSVSVGMLV